MAKRSEPLDFEYFWCGDFLVRGGITAFLAHICLAEGGDVHVAKGGVHVVKGGVYLSGPLRYRWTIL